jgi:hypothetical protein
MRTFPVVITACALVSLGPSAFGDRCKTSRDQIAAFLQSIDAIGHHAIETTLACLERGPDDAAVDQIAAQLKKAFSNPPGDPPKGCFKNDSELVGLVRVASMALGERVGVAYRDCTSKVQAQLVQLRSQGKTDEQIGSELKPQIDAWVGAAIQQPRSKH